MKKSLLLLLAGLILAACTLPNALLSPDEPGQKISIRPGNCYEISGMRINICNSSDTENEIGLVTIDVFMLKYQGWIEHAYMIPMSLNGEKYVVSTGPAKDLIFEMDLNFILKITVKHRGTKSS